MRLDRDTLLLIKILSTQSKITFLFYFIPFIILPINAECKIWSQEAKTRTDI